MSSCLNRKDCVVKSDIKTEKEVELDTSINAKLRRQSTSVDVTLTVKMAEIKKLREKCNNLEESECSLKVKSLQWRCIMQYCKFYYWKPGPVYNWTTMPCHCEDLSLVVKPAILGGKRDELIIFFCSWIVIHTFSPHPPIFLFPLLCCLLSLFLWEMKQNNLQRLMCC